MAKFVCDSGTIAFVGSSIGTMCINNVSVTIGVETATTRCMGDDGWQTVAATTKTWEVTFETNLDDTVGIDLTNTINATAPAALTFDTVDGLSYSGNAIITGADINAPVDDFATVSWTATGTGAIVEA